MDTFAALHGQHWESPRFGTDLSWVTPLSHRVGFKALAWQFRKMRVSLTERSDLSLPVEVHRMCEFVNQHDADLYRRWDQGPLTLIPVIHTWATHSRPQMVVPACWIGNWFTARRRCARSLTRWSGRYPPNCVANTSHI